MSAPKGGARHFSKPLVDSSLLYKVFLKHQDLINDFKSYEILSRNSAVDPRGLHSLLPLVDDLVKLEPTGEIHLNPMKAALLKLLAECPKLNNSGHKGMVWVELRAGRINTILYHLRRLAKNTHMPSMVNALTACELAKLQETLKKVEAKEGGGAEDEARRNKAKALKKADSASALKKEDSPTPPRKLKRTASDVSLDPSGFPKMLASPPTNFLKKKKAHGRAAETKTEASPRDLKKSLGLMKRPATLKKGKAPATLKKEPGLKKPAAKHGLSLKKDRLPWVKVLKTTGKKPERCYLTGTHDLAKKPSLIVEVTKTRSNNYSFVVDKIWEALKKDHLTKEEALDMRDALCARFP